MEGNQYRDAAGRIVEAVGKDNILSATHCATRLRLIVKDKERIDEKKLQEIGMVKGTSSTPASTRLSWAQGL
mgnify:CR=1 FL=1